MEKLMRKPQYTRTQTIAFELFDHGYVITTVCGEKCAVTCVAFEYTEYALKVVVVTAHDADGVEYVQTRRMCREDFGIPWLDRLRKEADLIANGDDEAW